MARKSSTKKKKLTITQQRIKKLKAKIKREQKKGVYYGDLLEQLDTMSPSAIRKLYAPKKNKKGNEVGTFKGLQKEQERIYEKYIYQKSTNDYYKTEPLYEYEDDFIDDDYGYSYDSDNYEYTDVSTIESEIADELSYHSTDNIIGVRVDPETGEILEEYIKENEEYDEYVDPETGEVIDRPAPGFVKISEVLFELLGRLEGAVPEQRGWGNSQGGFRSTWDLNESEFTKDRLLNLMSSKAKEEGYAGLSWRLQENAQHISELLDQMLSGYADFIMQAYTELASIINGGALTQRQALEMGRFESYYDYT